MAFCKKCGNQLEEDAEFCTECGTSVTKNNKRKVVFEGEIRKCPNCGEVLKSFTAICPACGHELNSKKVSKTLLNFIDEIKKCETNISSSKPEEIGWNSWSKSKKVWWIILNLIFSGIPLGIYLMIPLLKTNVTPKLSKEEKQMVSLIENFPFPNDRESILEALIFAKERINYLSEQKINSKNVFWIRLWNSKAEQLKQKADLMINGDKIVQQTYSDIQNNKEKINKIVKTKAGIGIIICIIVVLIFFSRSGILENIKNSNTLLEVPRTELSKQLPQIEGGKGVVTTNNSYYFSVEYYSISDKDFEEYKELCEKKGYTIDIESDGSLFDAYNKEGYNIRVTYYDNKLNITISDNMEFSNIKWPSSGVVKLIPKPKSNKGNISSSSDDCFIAYISDTTKEEYIEYVNKCIDKGFDKDISQTEDHFHADDKNKNSITVEYIGYNTMFIRVDK